MFADAPTQKNSMYVLVTYITVTCHSGTIADCSVLCNAEGGLVSLFFRILPFRRRFARTTMDLYLYFEMPVPYIRMLFLAVTSHVINTVHCAAFSLLWEVSVFPCVICDITLSQTSVGRRRSGL